MKLDDFLRDVAREYDALPVQGFRAPYDILCRELDSQYDLLRAFLGVEFTDRDPYFDSRDMFVDIVCDQMLRVYTIATLPPGHPFADLHRSGETYNTIFRAVHDGLAHFPGRYSFGKRGEFHAFRAHCRLLSPIAQWAIATETLGQNAWYHFAPNRPSGAPKTFVPQKYALLSRETVTRALTEDFD